ASPNPKIDSNFIFPTAEQRDPQSGQVTSSTTFEDRYQKVRRTAEKMIPAGVRWLDLLAQTERVIARATPRLMKEAIFRVAKANGAERVSIYPELSDTFFLGGPNSILQESRMEADLSNLRPDKKFLTHFV